MFQEISNNMENINGFTPLYPLIEDQLEENIYDYCENNGFDTQRRNSSSSFSSEESFVIGHTIYKDGFKHTIIWSI